MRKMLTLLLIVSLLALTGCGEKMAEKAIEKATGISVDEKSGTVTIQGKEGEKVTMSSTESGGGKAPEGFPLPILPGANVKEGNKLTINGKSVYTVEITFKGAANVAGDFYQNVLTEKGFKEPFKMESSDENQENITMSAETDTVAAIFFIEVEKKTGEGTITISYSDK